MEQSILKNILETKKAPLKRADVRVQFGKTSNIVSEEPPLPSQDIPTNTPRPMVILDKRKKSGLDRQFILNRLREQKMLLVKSNIQVEGPPPTPTPATVTEEARKEGKIIVKVKRKRLVMQPPEPTITTATTTTTPPAIEKLTEAPTTVEELTEKGPYLEEPSEVTAPIATTLFREPAAAITATPPPVEEPITTVAPTAPQKKTGKRQTTKGLIAATAVTKLLDLTKFAIGNQIVAERLPKQKEKIIIKAPSYYMNNRKLFIQKISTLFNPYRQDLLLNKNVASCDTQTQNTEFDLLTHQKIVRDYLNLYSPYRGLLLYHGLGSGKTCTSIALAEGMKSDKKVFVLTPASLKMNFFSEMKKCGDDLYKKNQYWEFVSIEGNPQYIQLLSQSLSLPKEYIEKNRGAWLVNVNKKTPTFTDLNTAEQNQIDEQLNMMIRSKYIDINYNGLNMKKVDALTENKTVNPFNNAVVIIDEAHNFVSRIVNKIRVKNSISHILYDYIMSAQNARIILLTGTPIINYPKEIAILFNMLRGYIKTWTMTVNLKEGAVSSTSKINTDIILDVFQENNFRVYDFVEYKGNKLTITRNPFGFINVVKPGVAKGTQRVVANKTGGAENRRVTRKNKKINNTSNTTSSSKRKTKNAKNAKSTAVVIPMETKSPELIQEELVQLEKDYNDPEFIGNNPYKGGSGVFDKYNGVRLNEQGNISDDDFIRSVIQILKKNFDVIDTSVELTLDKALPDGSEKKEEDKFMDTFVNLDTDEMKNVNLFQRRILGLTSYFRSAQEDLLPQYVKTEDGDIYHIEKTEMSAHQFGVYEKIRKDEADMEKRNRNKAAKNKDDDLFKVSSTYRIFSRAACNFVFPDGIERPVPNRKEEDEDKPVDEMDFDVVPKEVRQIEDVYSGFEEGEVTEQKDNKNPLTDIEDVEEDEDMKSYAYRIEKAMRDVDIVDENTNASLYLNPDALMDTTPKFHKILENLLDSENKGLHLLYSHFRTIEGIGILRLILLANGFAEFKLQKVDTQWEIIEKEEDADKPRFVLYTGTESVEEKEIIRNVYNGAWDFIPTSISTRLREQYQNNMYGEVIKLMMITSSGAEGINLKNTRFVHIVEPYWHMVRTEQVVGRARRICSHQDLPEEMRNVKVFLYVTTLSQEQKVDEKNIELRIRDVSRIDKKTPVTTDEMLYEIASIKNRINNQFLNSIKETAMDCNIYAGISSTNKDEEPLVCYGFGKVESNNFASFPSFDVDAETKEGLDVKKVRMKAIKVTIGGIEYAMNENTKELYDYSSYIRAVQSGSEPRLIGRLVNQQGQYKII